MLTKLKKIFDIQTNNLALDILVLSALIPIVDFLNIDNSVYQIICFNLKSWHIVTFCLQYYDLPLWQVLTSFGTILAGIFAYQAINQQNKQLHAEQIPIVVSPYGMNFDKTAIQLKNIGKGIALKVFASSDPEGQKPIQTENSPDFIYITPTIPTQALETVYIDPNKILAKNNRIVFYLHYFDSEKNLYQTKSMFKVLRKGKEITQILNVDNEVYQEKPTRIRLL